MPFEAFFHKMFYHPASPQWKVAPKEKIILPSPALAATSPATSKDTANKATDLDDDNYLYFQERESWMVYGLGDEAMWFLVPP
jgi:hypothetical protein